MSQTNSTEQESDVLMWDHMESMATFGGAGLSVCCSVLLVVILCTLLNVRKRLKRLELRNVNYKTETCQQKPLTQQTSNQSYIPEDIETIPRVPRRSEYIRHQKMANVAMEIRTRVSRLFSFGSTPRSSADTFDLSKEDPLYDDILQYRKGRPSSENEAYWCCCCCCKSTVNNATARTSDPEKMTGYSKAQTDDKTAETLEIPTVKDNDRNGILTKKKKQKVQKPGFQINVQHVEFDIREKRIQPTATDDVTIGVQPQPIKQINKENQLASFGKKGILGQKPHQNREAGTTVNIQMPQKWVNITGHGKKKFPGIPLPLPLPLKQSKSMPSVREDISRNNKETIPEESDQERDPSYIDMSETLKTDVPHF